MGKIILGFDKKMSKINDKKNFVRIFDYVVNKALTEK